MKTTAKKAVLSAWKAQAKTDGAEYLSVVVNTDLKEGDRINLITNKFRDEKKNHPEFVGLLSTIKKAESAPF